MSRLPTVGGDGGTWGTVLNDYLSQSINSDGTLTASAVNTALLTISIQTTTYGAGSTKSEFILADATTAGFTVTLPTAVSNKNLYTVKKTDSTSHFVTIGTTSAQTIDGGTTAVIKVQYASVTVVSDNANWMII